MILKFYKMYEDVNTPAFASSGSACFDVHAYINPQAEIVGWLDSAIKQIPKQFKNNGESVIIYPNERVLIPTGIIMDIPENHSVRLHARSGLAYKKGLVLANGEGIIDSDYVQEVKCMVHNMSDTNVVINNGDRVCQGELIKSLKYEIVQIDDQPKSKTDRDGGFGSTGE